MPHHRRQPVEWGDCDAAGIVFYPAFFRWMDAAFHDLTRACGFEQRDLAAHGLLGTPLVHAACDFRAPATYGEILDVELRLTRLGRSGLGLACRFARGGILVAEGTEARAFVRRSGAGEGGEGAGGATRIVPAEIPPALRAALAAHLEG